MAHPFYDKVIRALQECAVACSMCAVACLQEREVARMRDCILLDLDCADLCRTLIGMLGRTSEYSRELMVVCATLCDQCADVCEKYKDMEHCRLCAESCRECATICRNVSLS
jgi:hypothetical protein